MLVYDLECLRPPYLLAGKNVTQYEVAKGWQDYKGMDISVVCTYSYDDDKFLYFTKDTLYLLKEILDKENLIVGFNIFGYDNKMLAAQGIWVDERKCYDILYHLWAASGLNPNVYNKLTHSGFSMQKVVEVNLEEGAGKTMNGADAPYEWQDGNRSKVIDYCTHDVRLTKSLLDRIFQTGGLISPVTKTYVKMVIPYA